MKSYGLRFLAVALTVYSTSTFARGGGSGGTTTLFKRFYLEGKATKLGTSDYGYLGGLTSLYYFGSSPVSIGLSAYFGTPTGNALGEDSLLYAGVPLHFDGHIGKLLVYDLGIFAGYAQGRISSDTRTSFVLEQSIALGFALGNGWRLTASPGYLYNFSDPSLTGFTYGIRIERRIISNFSGRDS